MPDYKRQHYLPSVYLKQFSIDAHRASRVSLIWRLDPKKHLCVPVNSQCAKDYFYTKKEAESTESMFEQMENLYDQIAKKVWARTNLTHQEDFGLILMMLDLHCRNSRYTNRTGEENIKAYRIRIHCLRNHLLLYKGSQNATDEELFAHLHSSWRVRLLQPADENQLITSDNPSIWFTLDQSSGLHVVLMPVTPYSCAVAFDRHYCSVIGTSLTGNDQEILNQHQVLVCKDALFSAMALSVAEQVAVRQTWNSRAKQVFEVDGNKWDVSLRKLQSPTAFDFLGPPET